MTNNDVYFAIPSVAAGFTANDFSKYKEFVAALILRRMNN